MNIISVLDRLSNFFFGTPLRFCITIALALIGYALTPFMLKTVRELASEISTYLSRSQLILLTLIICIQLILIIRKMILFIRR